MGKITYFVHQSIDGYIEGPNGEFDWPVMGPELSEYSHGLNDTHDACSSPAAPRLPHT